ncbi:ABC transporter ATP-binding protein [Goodfellowiella coeruleoviolacea]|uniref:ABC-type multidrug transport system, ATPase and permease component n=1 Tax=Goodfellowiella coeruleoviolacea TaxID=334858 RepID=A0AAE3G8J4_9PSEU|nr:ABC transporter ATP-binding protein [Goodfellowiella coeruleoviolacea]MCP2163248.1 ABC-type multidrug transport system, ATPase and permease component [Goodfellowiella coeruleoviolacea]
MRPAPEDRPGRGDLALLWGTVADHWPAVLWSILAGVVYQAGSIALPEFVKRGLDQGVLPGNPTALVSWAVIIVTATLLSVLGLMGMLASAVSYSTSAANRLRARLLDHVLTLDRQAAARFGHGDLATRGTRDVDVVRTWLAGVASLVSGLCGLVTIVVAIALLDPLLAAVGLATVPLVVLVSVLYPKVFARANGELAAAHSARADAVEELLTGSVAVRGLGAERVLLDRHHRRSAEITAHTLAVARIGANWAAQAPFIPAAGTAIGLAVGGTAVLSGQLTLGGLVAFTSWMTMLSGWVGMLTTRVTQLVQAVASARRITEVLRTAPGVTDPPHPVALPATGCLELRAVRTRQRTEPISLRVDPGEFVALTGPLGSGKSSLVRLLPRLADPAEGTVSYGGVDLTSAALADVRSRVTFVPQRPTMLSGTIADNLNLGGHAVDRQRMREACRVAAIDTEIEALPDGYDTAVGERGATLSGGQLQRLALARGLLAGGRVLVLDDVTSAIDVNTELTILRRLRAWTEQPENASVTTVFVTHRQAVLDAADRVVTLAAPPEQAEQAGETGQPEQAGTVVRAHG